MSEAEEVYEYGDVKIVVRKEADFPVATFCYFPPFRDDIVIYIREDVPCPKEFIDAVAEYAQEKQIADLEDFVYRWGLMWEKPVRKRRRRR